MRIFQRFASRYKRSSYNDFYKRFLLEFRMNAQLTEPFSKQTFSSANGPLRFFDRSGELKNFVKKQFLNSYDYIPPVLNVFHNSFASQQQPFFTSNIFAQLHHLFTKVSSINLLRNLRVTTLN